MTERTFRSLILVVIPKVREKLEKLGFWDDLSPKLRAQTPVCLYNFPERGRRKKKGEKRRSIALPLPDGKGALLLQPHDKGCDFLVCHGVYGHPVHPEKDKRFFHELPGNTEIRVANWRRAAGLARTPEAVKCAQLRDEVFKKKEWDPSSGSDPEERKWKAYISLLRDVRESQRIDGLSVRGFNQTSSDWKRARVIPDVDGLSEDGLKALLGKINRTIGEDFKFRLTPDDEGSEFHFGRLDKISRKPPLQLTFELTPKFQQYFVEHICKEFASESGRLLAIEVGQVSQQSGAMVRVESLEPENESEMQDTPRWNFYLGESADAVLFSCPARRVGGKFYFAAGRLSPGRLFLFADYFGDLYQLDVMEDGVRRIKKRRGIWGVLCGEQTSRPPKEVECVVPPKHELNEEQKRAVRMALGNQEMMLVWGPPGTGKTSVIAEIARQEASRGRRTLIASQANLAVDNAMARLQKFEAVHPLRIVRTGKDYKLEGEDEKNVPTKDTAGRFFLDRLIQRAEKDIDEKGRDGEIELRKKFRESLSAMRSRLDGKTNVEDEESIKQMGRFHLKRVNVVGATLMRTGQRQFSSEAGSDKFDTVIVDEVSKALPPELFLPILRGKSVVLVGDHRQLPPILKDFSQFTGKDKSGQTLSYEQWAESAGTDVSAYDDIIFQRLWERHDDSCRVMLTKQYRMHEDIQRIVEPFYQEDKGGLECGLTHNEMGRMTVFPGGIFARKHVAWIDTDDEGQEERGGAYSFTNPGEIKVVGQLLELLPRGRRNSLSVGVITFYGAQLQELRKRYEIRFSKKFVGGINFGTVDRFQGRECDIIICSLVRNNRRGNVGFASVPNRVNVAFSRARRLLLIVGSSGQFLANEANDDGEARPFSTAYGICKGNGAVFRALDLEEELRRR